MPWRDARGFPDWRYHIGGLWCWTFCLAPNERWENAIGVFQNSSWKIDFLFAMFSQKIQRVRTVPEPIRWWKAPAWALYGTHPKECALSTPLFSVLKYFSNWLCFIFSSLSANMKCLLWPACLLVNILEQLLFCGPAHFWAKWGGK